MKRAKEVQRRLAANEFPFVDLAMYIIQVHATRVHFKGLLKKPEMDDVRQRLKIMWPLCEDLPTMSVGSLPLWITEKLQGLPVWRIEWFWDGSYVCSKTPAWKKRFTHSFGGEHGIYKMVRDTLGFSRFEMPFKMWLESLFRPNEMIYYEGKAFIHDMEQLEVQKCTMISVVYDYNHVMTITYITDN